MVGWKMSYLHLYSLEIPHFSIIILIHLMLKSVHLTRITRRSSHDHKRRWLNKVIHHSFSQCYVTQGLLQYISDNFSIGRADKMPEPRDSVTSQAAFKSFFFLAHSLEKTPLHASLQKEAYFSNTFIQI